MALNKYFSVFYPPEIEESNVLFHLMKIDLESVGSKLFVIPKSFELFINSFYNTTFLPRFEPSTSRVITRRLCVGPKPKIEYCSYLGILKRKYKHFEMTGI